MTTQKYVIRYDSSPGTITNGIPVGTVYVLKGYGRGVFSTTYDGNKATLFDYEEALRTMSGKSWDNAEAIPAENAVPLR